MSALVRTFFVFQDLPIHVEFKVSPLPMMEPGMVINMDVRLVHPKDPKRVREVKGDYKVQERKLVFRSEIKSPGLTQYLELAPVNFNGSGSGSGSA